MLLFGTAGVPNSSKRRDTISGIERVKELELECMEIEFVRGVRMKEELAKKVREVANELNIALSVHAPYFINLNAREEKKIEDSKKRIIASARIGHLCGARNIVFHAAYYMGAESREVYKKVKKAIEEILSVINFDVILRPETTGNWKEFGTLDEVISLSQELDNILPCIDFAHIHARTQKYNTYDEFVEILERLENELGKEAIKDMHIHISGIEYEEYGEKKHLNLRDSDMNYRDLLRALKDFNASGLVISESPNLEEDAILLKSTYKKL